MHELPLLIFTLLVQGSVGITLFLTLSAGAAKPLPQATRQLLPVLLTACVMGGLGLIASTLHLGYPLNAFNALRHVASSWLSREIVFASFYLAVLGLCTLILLVKKRLVSVLLPVAALLGLIDVWCMSAIYANSSIITWMHFNTWLMFYGAVGILGAVGMAWLPILNTEAGNADAQYPVTSGGGVRGGHCRDPPAGAAGIHGLSGQRAAEERGDPASSAAGGICPA